MPLDPSIILQAGRGITQFDPIGVAERAMSMRQAMLQQRVAQQQFDDNQAVRAAMARGEDPVQAMLKTGNVKGAHEAATAALQTSKAQHDAQKGQLELKAAWNARIAQLAQGATDQPSYDRALAQASSEGIPGVENMPKVYDPQAVRTLQAQAMTAKDYWEKQIEERNASKPQTELGQLEADFKAGRVREPEYSAMKAKLTTHAPAVNVNYGQPVAAVDEQGRPAFFMPGKKGEIKRVEGFRPAPKEKSKGKMDVDKMDAVISEAEKLISKAPGSYAGAGLNLGKRIVGVSDESTQAAAGLRSLEAQLMMNMPRMEGPQSDKDVALYRQQAGQIGDPTVPAGDKQAALKVIKDLTAKYRVAVSETPAPEAKPAAKPKTGSALPYAGKVMAKAKFDAMSKEARAAFISGGGRAE